MRPQRLAMGVHRRTRRAGDCQRADGARGAADPAAHGGAQPADARDERDNRTGAGGHGDRNAAWRAVDDVARPAVDILHQRAGEPAGDRPCATLPAESEWRAPAVRPYRFALNAAALTPVLWGLSELGGRHVPGWLALASVLAGLGIGALALRHARGAPHPLLSLAPLRHRTFSLTSGSGTIFMRLPITTLIFVLPILLQTGFGMTAFLAGLLFLAHSGGDLGMKLFTTRVYRRLGYRTTLLVSSIGMSVSIGACAFFTRSTPLAVMAIPLFVGGCFRSFAMTGLMTLAFSDVRSQRDAERHDVEPGGDAVGDRAGNIDGGAVARAGACAAWRRRRVAEFRRLPLHAGGDGGDGAGGGANFPEAAVRRRRDPEWPSPARRPATGGGRRRGMTFVVDRAVTNQASGTPVFC